MKRLAKQYLISVIYLMAVIGESASAIDLPKQINIYCISNMDGTGNCYEVKTSRLLKCIAVPGDIIPCKTQEGIKYSCIPFANSLFNCSLANEQAKTDTLLPSETDIKSTFKDRLRDDLETWGTPPTLDAAPKQETTKDKGGNSPPLSGKAGTPNTTILLPGW